MNKKLSFGKIVVLGFALFAMFFGAGNLILPPALGAICGDNWFLGFFMFILVDAGLSVIALLAFIKAKGGFNNTVSKLLSPKVAFGLTFVNTLFLGPLIAIPRTGATTFDIGIKPLLGTAAPWTSWVFGLVYFGLVAILCLRPGKVVDVIGKALAPVMLVALLILIGVGIVMPMGEVVEAAPVSIALSEGLCSGYQTMDMLGSVLLGVIALMSVIGSGITDTKSQMKAVGFGGLVAALGLFIVYGGLCYLGATVSGQDEMVVLATTSRPDLLLTITNRLMGPYGKLILGIIVSAACLTTAIGLTSACAQNFTEITKGKLPYKPTMLAIIGISYLLSNLGTEKILTIAAPVLNVIFPIYILLVFISFLPVKISEQSYAAPFAVLTSVIINGLVEIHKWIPSVGETVTRFPLAAYGFGWLLPSLLALVIGIIVGICFPRKRGNHLIPVLEDIFGNPLID